MLIPKKQKKKKEEEAFITQTLAGKFDSHKYENVTCNIKHLACLKVLQPQ
jgi:hypothetical protein